MLQTEYVRSLNCNYERILLDEKPDEKRYQYCILGRGGIKGLLPCSLRYINGRAYLYYDISSRQNVAQLYGNRSISRDWIKDFAWGLKQVQQELGRFLLDTGNILWYPEQIFQDLESNIFSFMYIPYYKGESSFIKLMDFWVEHIDYEDDVLVDCIYHMYEQMERNGESYLQHHFFEDVKSLEKVRVQEQADLKTEESPAAEEKGEAEAGEVVSGIVAAEKAEKAGWNEKTGGIERTGRAGKAGRDDKTERTEKLEDADKDGGHEKTEKKGILGIIEGRKQRNKRLREDYRASMRQAMEGYAVAEDTAYCGEEYGRTIYVEEKGGTEEQVHRLYTAEGKFLVSLKQPVLSIGKKKEEVDLALGDASVSRLHARIVMEKGCAYLEDLNSTNGTFKNGLRLQPYEKRKLEEDDEVKCGRVVLIFR
ncbi:MAG: FHA domain-containing protein [Acetatifactor muris]|nr:FHA domain-containing protein [Acetatifactor muris]